MAGIILSGPDLAQVFDLGHALARADLDDAHLDGLLAQERRDGRLPDDDAEANQAKGDKLPSEWMPDAWRSRCAYGRRMVDVAKQYALPLPKADLRAVRRACSGVAGLVARREL